MTYEVGKFKLNLERLNEVEKLLLKLERSIEVRRVKLISLISYKIGYA